MIKVNLLRSIGGDQGGVIGGGIATEAISSDLKRQAAVKLICIFILPLLLYLYENLQVSELEGALKKVEAQIADVDTQRSSFGDAGPKIEKFTAEKKEIDKQLEAVRALTKDRLREVKSLDALQSLVPAKTWFKKITIEGNIIKLMGFTTSDEGVADLIKALDTAALFSKVEPKATVQESLPGGGQAKRFEIEFRYGRAGQL